MSRSFTKFTTKFFSFSKSEIPILVEESRANKMSAGALAHAEELAEM
jgi:hypothetical protein